MKNRSLIFVSICMLAAILVTSCTDSFLQTDPIGKASVESFYQSDEDATMAIAATYDILQWQNARDWNSLYMVKTLPSDETEAGGSSSADQPPYQRLNDFTFSAENPAIAAAYEGNYYGIYRANLIINNVQPETDVRKQVIAEAKFLRAYFYFELVSMFGDVPLNLTELAPSEYSQPRTPAAEVYTQIEKDLNEAISVLPLKSEYAAKDKFRASKGAAQSLLGKAHLYQEEWEAAATAFDAVIKSNEYQLVDDYSELFKESQELGPESIFEVVYVSDIGYDYSTFQFGGVRAMENNIQWQLTGPRGPNFEGGTSGMIAGWGFNYPTEKIYQAYVDANDVVRRRATVWSEEELNEMGGKMDPDPYQYEGYIRVKYGTFSSETNSSDGAVPELNYGTNLRLIRYSDVLLMAAEAYYRSSNEPQARIELNKVRTRAELPPVTASGDDLFEAIVLERQLELAMEGKRYLDLIRWGRASEELGDKGYMDGKHNLFPIPAAELRSNQEINQNNPGY